MKTNYNLEELEQLVIDWAKQRGLLDNPSQARLTAQFGKTIEEMAELEQAIMDDDKVAIMDAIGDIAVTLIIRKSIIGLLVRGEIMKNMKSLFQTPISYIENHIYEIKFALYDNGLRSDYYLSPNGDGMGDYQRKRLHYDSLYALELLHHTAKHLLGSDLRTCLEHAYNQIKDRTGKMVNNQFVKDK